MMFIEWPQGTFHLSLCAKNVDDVSEIAIQFGGGGHVRASGASLSGVKLDELMNDVLAKAEAAITTVFSG